MVAVSLRHVLGSLCKAAAAEAGGATDGQLLQRFLALREEAAFATLLQRHGPMVLGVCRRVLGHAEDAEDAFQATFLVLVRSGNSVRKHQSLGSWLYGVAWRVAARAKTRARRRRVAEAQIKPVPSTDPEAALTRLDLRSVLDDELQRLPEKYRAPLVLCYLQGKTNEEAARLLGWTKGSVSGRLARARDLLRGRLTRRGVAPAVGGADAALAQQMSPAVVPASLAAATLRAADGFATPAVALAEGVLKAMLIEKWRKAVLTLLGVICLVTGAGTGAAALYRHAGTPPPPDGGEVLAATPEKPVAPPADEPSRKPAPEDPKRPAGDNPFSQLVGKDQRPLFDAINRAELVFTAKVKEFQVGGAAGSEPPIWLCTITFEDVNMLRGEKPAVLKFNYQERGKQQPNLGAGSEVLVTAWYMPDPKAAEWRIHSIRPATEAALAKEALSLPVGWTVEDAKPVSPWAALGDKASLPQLKDKAKAACAKCGRPALLAGPGIELTVQCLMPDKLSPANEPATTGQFKVTVTNRSGKDVEVPALLAEGDKILWGDSLLVLLGADNPAGKPLFLPTAGSAGKDAKPLTLKRGESVSTVVDTLKLKDLPRTGGSRHYFQFCLGELTRTDFFYR